MDFLPTDDQRALRDGVRDALAQLFPVDRLFEVTAGIDAAVWSALADMGVFSLRLPESAGGLGVGLAETALVFEELGASLVPGPLVASHLAASLPGVSPGAVVTVLDEASSPLLVSHLGTAARVVLVRPDSLELLDRSALQSVALADGIDPLTPLAEVVSVGTGTTVGDADDVRRWRLEGALLTAALQVGIASRLTTMAVAYAQQREQFGRAIGGFQAVKHLAADMYVRAELATVAVEAGAVTLDDPSVGDAARAVAGAKLLADEAAHLNSRSCVQIHGGMGFTWEVPVHLFLKRAWVQATEWGHADVHAEALAELL